MEWVNVIVIVVTRCCIRELDVRVQTKAFTTVWHSKDKHRAVLHQQELSFREMFPYELQVKKKFRYFT